jgi:hypothetical protein
MRKREYPAAAWRALTIPVTRREGMVIAATSGVVTLGLLSLASPQTAAQAGSVPGVAPVVRATVARVMPLAAVEVTARPRLFKPKRLRFALHDADATSFKQLNSYYVGRSRVEKVDWDNVDLAKNVEYMWARKAQTFKVTPATTKSVKAIVARYRASPHQTTTLKAYIKHADTLVERARSGLDYPGLCARYHVTSDRCVRLEYMTGRINGEMLVAYGMTELMPSGNGEVNRAMLDMLLRRAGADYLNVVPALGDKFLSLGPYQFTSYAVRHDADGRQGANIVAEFGKVRIPGSVAQLTPDDQHVAAFYFATYNLMRLVNRLTPGEYAHLKQRSPVSQADLTVFMATAHHAPGRAIHAARLWLQSRKPESLAKYQSGDNVVYAAKSKANLRAL